MAKGSGPGHVGVAAPPSVYSEHMEKELRTEFSHVGSITYLDNAGAALYPRSVVTAAANSLLTQVICSPHTSPATGEKINGIRRQILQHFRTNDSQYQVVFTSGATAAIRLVADTFPWDERSTLAYLDECHTSVVGMRELALRAKAQVICLSREAAFADSFPDDEVAGPSLVVFPAMSNFCGYKFDLGRIATIKGAGKKWYVLLDAAAFVATNNLDLSEVHPDFVCLSFYKIFGFPTGLGCLLVKNEALTALRKHYFGGGTVEMHLVSNWKHVPRRNLIEAFEDGTLPFHQILALADCFNFLKKFPRGLTDVSQHTFHLAKYLYDSLRALQHKNGNHLVELYASTNFDSISRQGAIVNFNLKKADGSHYGFNAFRRLAEMEKIVVRTGCFCNIGSCQKYLGYGDADVRQNFERGHVCGDDVDLVDGRPTGSIRISFGCYSTKVDVDRVVGLLKTNFLNVGFSPASNVMSREAATVQAIYLYPIKSCAPMAVREWEMTESGFMYDRHWVVMQRGQCLTQKKMKALCLLQPSVDLSAKSMTLTYPKMDSQVSVPLDYGDVVGGAFRVCVGKVCNEHMEGIDCGDEVSQWLEEALGEPDLRLVRQTLRMSKAAEKMTLANEAPYLVLNRASATELGKRILHENGHLQAYEDFSATEKLLAQFRGNIVVGGATAFCEDHWERIILQGGRQLVKHSKCMRCSMISIDQETGGDVKGIVKTLTYMPDRAFCFGVLFKFHHDQAKHDAHLTLKVGDTLTFLTE